LTRTGTGTVTLADGRRWPGDEDRPVAWPTRAYRRGHIVVFEDFLPSDSWHCDNGYTDAEFATACHRFLACV
jgi:hypothetical protein